jgi:hypothetical protein
VLCAYLRMPYTPPGEPPTDDDPKVRKELLTVHREAIQEREVRLAAQRILPHHLRPGNDDTGDPVETFWTDIDLDLTGAVLIDFGLDSCTVRTARFGSATFTGTADFASATFTAEAVFYSATFTDHAHFGSATFAGEANFWDATFARNAEFELATFTGTASFTSATFAEGMPSEMEQFWRPLPGEEAGDGEATKQ